MSNRLIGSSQLRKEQQDWGWGKMTEKTGRILVTPSPSTSDHLPVPATPSKRSEANDSRGQKRTWPPPEDGAIHNNTKRSRTDGGRPGMPPYNPRGSNNASSVNMEWSPPRPSTLHGFQGSLSGSSSGRDRDEKPAASAIRSTPVAPKKSAGPFMIDESDDSDEDASSTQPAPVVPRRPSPSSGPPQAASNESAQELRKKRLLESELMRKRAMAKKEQKLRDTGSGMPVQPSPAKPPSTGLGEYQPRQSAKVGTSSYSMETSQHGTAKNDRVGRALSKSRIGDKAQKSDPARGDSIPIDLTGDLPMFGSSSQRGSSTNIGHIDLTDETSPSSNPTQASRKIGSSSTTAALAHSQQPNGIRHSNCPRNKGPFLTSTTPGQIHANANASKTKSHSNGLKPRELSLESSTIERTTITKHDRTTHLPTKNSSNSPRPLPPIRGSIIFEDSDDVMAKKLREAETMRRDDDLRKQQQSAEREAAVRRAKEEQQVEASLREKARQQEQAQRLQEAQAQKRREEVQREQKRTLEEKVKKQLEADHQEAEKKRKEAEEAKNDEQDRLARQRREALFKQPEECSSNVELAIPKKVESTQPLSVTSEGSIRKPKPAVNIFMKPPTKRRPLGQPAALLVPASSTQARSQATPSPGNVLDQDKVNSAPGALETLVTPARTIGPVSLTSLSGSATIAERNAKEKGGHDRNLGEIRREDAQLVVWKDVGRSWPNINVLYHAATNQTRAEATLRNRYKQVKSAIQEAAVSNALLERHANGDENAGLQINEQVHGEWPPSRKPDNEPGRPADLGLVTDITQHDATLIRRRDHDRKPWKDIIVVVELELGLKKSEDFLRRRYRNAKKAFQEAGITPDMIEKIANNDPVTRKLVDDHLRNHSRSGDLPSVSPTNGSGEARVHGPRIATPVPPTTRQDSVVIPHTQQSLFELQSAARPQYGCKTIDANFYQNLEAINQSQQEQEEAEAETEAEAASEDESDSESEDEPEAGPHYHVIYRLYRREILNKSLDEESEGDDDESNPSGEYMEVGPRYTNREEANTAASAEVMKVLPSCPVFANRAFDIKVRSEPDGTVSYSVINEDVGRVDVVVQRQLRTTNARVVPKADEIFAPTIYFVKERITTKADDEGSAPSTSEKVLDNTPFTDLGLANTVAINHFVDSTFQSTSGNLKERDVEKMEQKSGCHEKLGDDGLFEDEAVEDDGKKVRRVWVERGRLAGPRN